mmetsp:Transcript_5115/g.11232  ORF Transcript_5115/g.11232 Transcript_5115/m.11232 type:complete len:312 (-) Transcript_5115:149-1084(-)
MTANAQDPMTPSDPRLSAPLSSERSSSSSATDGADVVGGSGEPIVGTSSPLVTTTTGDEVLGVATGASVSHGRRQLSVALQVQASFDPSGTVSQVHSSAGYVSPQQVSVPSVQVAPSTVHAVAGAQAAVSTSPTEVSITDATTTGAGVVGFTGSTGSGESHGRKQLSVALQVQASFDPSGTVSQVHSSAGYVSPQQVSVPSVQVAPSTVHAVAGAQAAVSTSPTEVSIIDATTTGAGVVDITCGSGSRISHGRKQLSVARQSQVNPPPLKSSWQLHSSEGYVSPQQLSVPSVQVAPASSHRLPPRHLPSSP